MVAAVALPRVGIDSGAQRVEPDTLASGQEEGVRALLAVAVRVEGLAVGVSQSDDAGSLAKHISLIAARTLSSSRIEGRAKRVYRHTGSFGVKKE